MFAKVFEQIFESSIAEDYHTRHVFMDLLVLADEEGVIDKTPGAISRITNVPLRVLTKAIDKLCSPDEESRTDTEDGRRLVLIDAHRTWGWRIVNYLKYRGLRDEDARRLANRSYKREQRSLPDNKEKGYVYYVKSPTGIKIGFSRNPWSRINEMKCFSPHLELLAIEAGNLQLEKYRHKQFSAHRIDREWFVSSPEILAHIAGLKPVVRGTSHVVQDYATTSAHTEAEAEADTEVDKSKPMTRSLKFALPSIGELSAYCSERKNRIDPQQFFDYYTANGWKVGRNLMRDWRAAVRTWEKNNFNRGGGNGSTLTKAEQRTVNTRKALLADAGYDFDEAVGSGSEAVPDGDSAGGTEIMGEVVGRGKAERR